MMKDWLNPKSDAHEMLEAEADVAIETLARDLRNDRDFIRVLQECKPELRHEVYKKIRPHVGYGDPRPFELMSFDCDA
jgi:hypothetical protein